MSERDIFEDQPDEPELSTDDVDAGLGDDTEDEPWFDAESGDDGA
jgi:hypothetical protein